jgi:DNA-binding SARP family transcriptional activator/predicted ATPase
VEPLRIHLLGGFLLEQGQRTLPPIPSRAARSLFAYLAVNRDRRHTRDLLAGLFWPDLPEAKARRRLSQALWQVQDVLAETSGAEPYLLTTPDAIVFNTAAPYTLDVEQFERALHAVEGVEQLEEHDRWLALDQLRAAVEMYRGDFLAGFYDDWVTFEQERLRERYLDALTTLVDLLAGAGDNQQALAYARRLTNHDPLREDAHRAAIRLYFLLGRVNDALQQYERCRAVLSDELGAEPSPETQALYERIVRYRENDLEPVAGAHGAPSPLFRRDGAVPFVGRREERAILVDRIELALRSQGGVVLVEGDPGVGKTRLVREVSDDARWRGFDVLWARCHGTDVARPYAPLAEALGASLTPLRAQQLAQRLDPIWLRSLARLDRRLAEWLPDLPDGPPLRPGEEQERLREALLRAILALARTAPLLLVVDDVQWADHETLDVLRALGGHLDGSRVLVCLTARREESRDRDEVWETLRDIDRQCGRGRLLVGPFTVFELGELVRRSLGAATVPPRFCARLLDETGGNALFALETLRALRDQGRLETGVADVTDLDGLAGSDQLPITPDVHRVVTTRVSALSDDETAVVELSAIRGCEVDVQTLEYASELPRGRLLDALDGLLARGLLVESEHGYVFHHEQVRSVVEGSIRESTRPDLHRRLAGALARTHPDDVEALARHYGEAGVGEVAVRYLVAAGLKALELHAYRSALHSFARAAQIAPDATLSPRDRFDLLAQQEGCLDVLGRREDQAAVLDELDTLAGDDVALQAEVARRRAWLSAHAADFDDAEVEARRAVHLHEQVNDRTGAGASLVALAAALRWSGRSADAVPTLQTAIDLLEGDVLARAEARCELGHALREMQRYDEARKQLALARSESSANGDARGEAEALGVAGVVAMEEGDMEAAERALREALERCRAIGYRHGEGVQLVNLANLCYSQDRVADALSCYDGASALFSEIANRRGEALVRANAAWVRHSALGDDDTAERDARNALEYFRGVGDRRGEAHCLDVLGSVAARAGRLDDATTLLRHGLAVLADVRDAWLELQLQRSTALVEIARGDAAAALGRLDAAITTCRATGTDEQRPGLVAARGLALLELGRAEDALTATAEAVDGLGAGAEYACAALWWHHRAVAALGDETNAAITLERAHAELVRRLDGLEPAPRRRAIDRVPEHAAIAAAHAVLHPTRLQVRLPSAEAPTGRSLREEDLVEVTWTVEAPEDVAVVDVGERRRRQLVRLLEEATAQGAAPTVDDLAEAVGSSRSTVRRDLATLRQLGSSTPTRGHRLRD